MTSEAYGLDTRSDQPVVRGFYSVQYLDGMTKLFGMENVRVEAG